METKGNTNDGKLGYIKLKGLKEVFRVGKINVDKNELAFSELVQYLDKRSLSIVMREH